MDHENIRWIIVVSVVCYFIFDFFEFRVVKDEREELVRLKTFELIHRLNTLAILAMVLLMFVVPEMLSSHVLTLFILTSMYGEIAGKIYFRWRL